MTTQELIVYAVGPVGGYLLGSVPFALVIGKMKGVDIRTVGSKNIGATNLGRTLGAKYFWYAFLLDAAKGFLPVLVMSLIVNHSDAYRDMVPGPSMHTLPSWAPLLTAIACVLGHTFPLWLKFKGGKGVATSFGATLGFWPLYTLAGLGGGLVFVAVLMVYRYISLASILGALGFLALVAVLGSNQRMWTYRTWDQLWPLVAVAGLFALLIIVKHRGNIGRLMKGTEPKIKSGPPREKTA